MSDGKGIVLGDVLAALVGAGLSHFLLEKEINGKKTWELSPTFKRFEAPHFAKSKEDEARFAQVTALLSDALAKRVIETWLAKVGKNQRADFILSVAEGTVGNTKEEIQDNERRMLIMLERIARRGSIPEMTEYAVGLRFMKPREEDYFVVKLINTVKATPAQIAQLANFLKTAAENGAKTFNENHEKQITQLQTDAANALTRAKARFQRARR